MPESTLTYLEWFKLHLSLDDVILAVNNFEKHYVDIPQSTIHSPSESITFCGCLLGAFVWDETSQGYDYWNKLADFSTPTT